MELLYIIKKKKIKLKMANYIKDVPRLNVKFLDGDDTSKVLFEVNNRNH